MADRLVVLLRSVEESTLWDLAETYELESYEDASRAALVDRLLRHPEVSAREILDDLLVDAELRRLAVVLDVRELGPRAELVASIEQRLEARAGPRVGWLQGVLASPASRVDVAVGFVLAAICVAALWVRPALSQVIGPYEAVHYTFVEQETRNYARRGTSEPEETYVDPWGRYFVERDLGGEYALYSRGLNGVDDAGKLDDVMMYGPGLPCFRFGHTRVGATVSWSRAFLLALAAALLGAYLGLRTIPRRSSKVREALLAAGLGLPLAVLALALFNGVWAWVPETEPLSPLMIIQVFASLALPVSLSLFALRLLHAPGEPPSVGASS